MSNETITQTVPEKLITRKELRSKLGISETTAWRLDKTGALPSIRIGGSRRYSWNDVVASLQKTGSNAK